MGDHIWASEEEKREQFHAETVSLASLRAQALEKSDFSPREIRSMTRAELIRLIQNDEPRD